ncbi:hypothetical protein FOWG_09018 [Fusarium oxysporum f. sp. lycopersici MN25]|nr:hypothetical protein FOWG_09018 [Fusarium oxysporum f. sp. lycopersici MN25]
MTKAIAVLLTLLGIAFAQIDRTCIDIVFNSETNTLSGKCQPRDNSGYIPSELDLNDCFGYDGTDITPTYHGNFAESCHGCEMFVAPDPWYGGAEYWIRCTCKGQSEKVAVPLEAAVAHDSLSAQECVESSLYSHALSHIYVPLYYLSDNYCGFRAAVKNADFEAMNRCVKYGGAQDTTRELPKYNGYEKGCQCIAERPHTQHRPIDEPLESVYLGKDVNTHCDNFPNFLITMLSKSPDRVYTEGICQMIKLPQSYGYSLPFNMESDTYWYSENADRYLSGITRKPLDVALRSHCPLYLLEVIIRDYTRRRVDFTTTYVDLPASMQSWAGDYRFACDEYPVAQQWWKYTNLLETTWGLFLDLTDTSTS